jgi:asparagine synthase (glutamine-hydrolysing)
MCGFAAFFAPGRRFAPSLLDGAEQDLFHRGPDSGGRWEDDGWALVFRRLSIIDNRAVADQPMLDQETGSLLVFNGEIYNHLVLRRDLEALGHRFRTESDTETLLVGYRQWGRGVLDRLEGMFAFVIVDQGKGVALAARDPFGIKPLYFVRTPECTAFASEMRPLLRLTDARTDADTVLELLVCGFAGGANSNLTGIERVPGGTFLEVPLAGGDVRRGRYFDPLAALEQPPSISPADAVSRAHEGIEQSVRAHLMSDVGYTIELSGGVDSSLVAAIAARHSARGLKSFGLKLPEGDPRDESQWRKLVVGAYGLDHEEINVDSKVYADAFERAVRHMEGPVPHGGCVLLMVLCERARHSSKVILTGEGADEFFGGYERYKDWRKLGWREAVSHLPFARMLPNRPPFRGMHRLIGRDAAVASSIYVDPAQFEAMAGRRLGEIESRVGASRRFPDIRRRIYAVDRMNYLDSLLLRQDKMSMAASVEARVPFVHRPLASVVDRIPREVMSPGGETKPVLKQIAEKYLPASLVRRRKIGLTLDYRAWLRDENGIGRFLDWLGAPDAALGSFLDRRQLKDAVAAARNGSPGPEPFRLVNVEVWLRTLRDAPKAGPIFA